MSDKPKDRAHKAIMQNRRARHEFEIVSTLEAGIVLQGTEVKSLRAGKANMQDAYVIFPDNHKNDMYVTGLHINPYEQGNRENHEPLRLRKLLVHAKEAVKLRTQLQEKGMSLIPLSMYFAGSIIKMEIGVGRGKKLYDKRAATKERDVKRDLQRMKF